MRIEFILPRHSKGKKEFKLGRVGFSLPSLTLASLAACVPDQIEVELTDEYVHDIKFDGNGADLIGINTRSQTAMRAYSLADRFRKLGKTVIMGGVHASLLPEEALEHADSVVVGEAEGFIEVIIEDFKKKRLKQRYGHDAPPDISHLPLPRRELLYEQNAAYAPVDLVMLSRGCPYSCSFCYMSGYYGSKYRLRSIESVTDDVEKLRHRLVFFVDDNLAGYPKYSLKLFERLIPYQRIWVGQATINVTNDLALLRTLAKSGCRCLFIGFESLSQESLDRMGKRFSKVHQYKEKIRVIQDHGIMVYGGFILGLDEDNRDVFDRTAEFAIESGIDIAQFHCPNPYPKTRLYDNLLQQNRLLDEKWWLNESFSKVRYRPKNMSSDELNEGILSCYKQFYRGASFLKRFSVRHLTDLPRLALFLLSGMKFRNGSVPWIIN